MSTMKTAVVISCALLVLILVITGSSSAEIPKKINYQGRLTDSATGSPLAGTHNMTFRIYDESLGGDLLWSESRTVFADSAGVVSVILGGVSPIDISFDGACWLEVEVSSEILLPRRELVSVPYAFHASDSDSLGGSSSDAYLKEDELSSITGDMITDGEITDDDISGDASIDPAKIYGTAWTAENDGAGSGLDADTIDGLNADAFADTGHIHDDRYFNEEELHAPGTMNDPSNPVDWTNLKNVPAGFSDGTDDVGGVGDGYSLDAVDGHPTDAVFVDVEGRVGVGTANPAAGRLVVLDSAGTTIYAGTEVGTSLLAYSPDGTALNGYTETGYSAYLTGQVFVDGSVGLGTLSPERKLHIVGDNPRILIDAASSNPEVNFRNSGDTFGEMWALYKEDATDDLRLFQSGDRVTFKSGTGSVGIGTSNPVARLDVVGGINTSSDYKIDGKPVLQTDMDRSLFVGIDAGANCTGTEMLCVGDSAGYNSQGIWSTFLGKGAGFSNASWGNTFVGWHAGYSNTSGERNLFVGRAAGATNTIGTNNTFVGEAAGNWNDDGGGNVFVGTAAGYQNTQGLGNTFLGSRAGGENTTGVENTYLGYDAGYFGSGSYNTYVGARVADEAKTGSRNVFIGYQAGHDEEGSDKLIIANGYYDEDVLVYGDFTTGRIGLGTLSPEQTLHLKGTAPRILIEGSSGNSEVNLKTVGDPSSEVWAMYKHSSEDDLRFYQGVDRVTFEGGTGNVAIGTTDPIGYRLYVSGTAYATGGWQPSDLRLKTDVRRIDDALGKLLKLNGICFRWRTEDHTDRGLPEGRHYGLIAQEVEAVLPEAVATGPDGVKALAYSEIIPVLVESIKELKAENEILKQRLGVLEKTQGHQ